MKKIIGGLLILLFCTQAKAQQITSNVVSSGGSYIENTSLSLQFTIGEALTEYYTTSAIQLGQGFQQVYPNSVVTAIVLGEVIHPSIKLYPNPVRENLTVRFENLSVNRIEIRDVTGKLHSSDAVLYGNSHQLNTALLPQGMYFLSVLSNNTVQNIPFQKLN